MSTSERLVVLTPCFMCREAYSICSLRHSGSRDCDNACKNKSCGNQQNHQLTSYYQNQHPQGQIVKCESFLTLCVCGTCDFPLRICYKCTPYSGDNIKLSHQLNKFAIIQKQLESYAQIQKPDCDLISFSTLASELEHLKSLDKINNVKQLENLNWALSYEWIQNHKLFQRIRSQLIQFLNEGSCCNFCDKKNYESENPMLYLLVWKDCATKIICESCQFDDPQNQIMFSKLEANQLIDLKHQTLTDAKFNKLVQKLIRFQCVEDQFLFDNGAIEKSSQSQNNNDDNNNNDNGSNLSTNSANVFKFISINYDQINLFLKFLNYDYCSNFLDKNIKEFRAREHQRIEDIADQAKELFSRDFNIIKNFLYQFSEDGEIDVKLVKSIVESYRFQKILEQKFTYFSYAKSNVSHFKIDF